MKTSLWWSPLLFMLAAGCSVSAVPKIDATKVHVPKMQKLEPRTLSLQVVEKRAPVPEGSGETLAEVERVLRDRLSAARIEVSDESPNSLLVELHHVDKAPSNIPPKYCVKLKAYLSLPTLASPGWSEGGACFAVKHLLTGATIPSKPNESYESALTTALEGLDEVLERSFGDRI